MNAETVLIAIVVYIVCGIPDDKLVEAHGSFLSASCIDCQRPHPSETVKVSRPIYQVSRSLNHETVRPLLRFVIYCVKFTLLTSGE
jgi:hypothetical protein